ncbi:hypothetical protein D3C71_1364900 [compost metagenome]
MFPVLGTAERFPNKYNLFRKDHSMISYVILAAAFLYTCIHILRLFIRGRRPLSKEEIDEKLLATLNGGDRTHG